MAKHRSHAVHTLRAVVSQVSLNRRTHHTRSELRTHGQLVTVQTVGEAKHLFLNNIGHIANPACEQISLLQYRRAHIAVAITF